jgi:hypothetical protein
MGCLVIGRSFGLDLSEVASGMSSVSAAMRGIGKEASDYPRLLCGRQLAAKGHAGAPFRPPVGRTPPTTRVYTPPRRESAFHPQPIFGAPKPEG